MEENLDRVAEGKLQWKNVVSDYYKVLEDEIKTAKIVKWKKVIIAVPQSFL